MIRYTVRRGEYQGTTDNRLDRWYIQQAGEDFRPFGAGFATKREATEAAKRAETEILAQLDS